MEMKKSKSFTFFIIMSLYSLGFLRRDFFDDEKKKQIGREMEVYECEYIFILLKEKYPFENVLTSLIKLPIFLLVFSVAFMKYPKTNKTA